MRYFAQKARVWVTISTGGTPTICNTKTYEVTSKYALQLYKACSDAGKFNLVAVPNHKKGTRVDGNFFSVWGEVITDAECFKRQLNGTLGNGILNKRIG